MPESTLSNNNSPNGSYELLMQLSTGPTLREVAAATLRSALKEQYPTLDIDPDLAKVVTPRWRAVGNDVTPILPGIESLTSVLIRHTFERTPVIYIDGVHFLTPQENTWPLQYPVKIDAIARLINELSHLLNVAFQEQQLDYWNSLDDKNSPRWKAFAKSLRNAWDIPADEDWDTDEREIAGLLRRFPVRTERAPHDNYATRAYLVDIDLQQDGTSVYSGLLDMIVLIGEHDQRQLIIAHSTVYGFFRFESLTELGAVLPTQLNGQGDESTLNWRLFEPPGDIFDYAACTIIDLQIQSIGHLGMSAGKRPTQPQLSPVTSVLINAEQLSAHEQSAIRQVSERLPDWMFNASDLDISNYSRLTMDLAELHSTNGGRLFDDGIAPIREYAREQLNARISAHPQGSNLKLDDIEIRIETPIIWGTFALPGQTAITRRSLIDLALENLTGLPIGQTSVHYNGALAPEWLTYDYLKEVIESIDVGEHYPALIKKILLDTPAQSTERQTLYIKHLRVQLPLLALQFKIQHKNGIDGTGFRYVSAALRANPSERRVDGEDVVIRPLAFVPTLRSTPDADTVANMFVIEAKDDKAGPCLLYRPALEPVLVQYPSRQNLIYALKNSQPLRDSVLAWLPQDAQFNYAQFVFPETLPSPWSITRVLTEPQVVLEMSGPITLSNEVVADDGLTTLFKATVSAMVELATRQSVSNVQKRWAAYRAAGWLMFNAALPFLGRTVGAAAWIWQIMEDLEPATRSAEGANEQTVWAARVDLLLNLGMALTMHLATRDAAPNETGELKELAPAPEPATKTTIVTEAEKPVLVAPVVNHLPTLPTLPLPATHQGILNSSGALGRNLSTLVSTLDSFKLTQPANLGEQNKTPGSHLHLYPLADKWYAVVGERWFEVTVDEGDNVQIIDPNDASRTGPMLTTNGAGQWFIDLRLRLRGGGGFRKKRRGAQADKSSRIEDLREKINAFDRGEHDRHQAFIDTVATSHAVGGGSTSAQRQAVIERADQQLKEYEVPIAQLRSLAIIDTVPNYQGKMINYLHSQLVITCAAARERTRLYLEDVTDKADLLDPGSDNDPKKQAEVAQNLSTQNLDLISRVERSQTLILELGKLGAEGVLAIENIGSLPDISTDDLKTYQLTLSRFLCIAAEAESEAITSARAQFDQICDTVELNIQSLMDALADTDSALDERLEVLNSLVERLSNVDQRLLDLHSEFSEHVKREPLQNLREQLEAFKSRAVQVLVALLREQRAKQPAPRMEESATAAPKPKKKIIKTRFNGVQIGEAHASDASLVDIKAPITGKVIATFHEKTPGVWVERVRPSANSRAQQPQSLNLRESIATGQTLLDEEPATVQRLLAISNKPGRIPVEIEEIFHQHASRLERVQSAIEEAMTQRNLTEVDEPTAALLNNQLNEAAQRLYTLGTHTRISLIKQQPPTAARVEWLHTQGQVTVAKIGTRKRLKGPGKDYLDEYEVRDPATQKVLWYGHFHYLSAQAGVTEFVAGHLKTAEQRKLGGALQRTGLSDGEQIAIYRSEIPPPLAQSLFFAPGPAQ